MNGEISYLVDTANKYLTATDPNIDEQAIQRGGLKIYTTFNKAKVQALKNAVDEVQSASLRPDKREADKFVQVGASSVDPKTGAIVALYGGPGVENNHYTNNADAPGIPVGSTFKPFVLATAMQVGVLTKTGPNGQPTRISTDSRYLSDNLSQIYKPDGSPVIGDDGKPYHQANDENNKTGYVDLKEAMRNSYNVPFVQLGQDVGGKNVEDMAIRLGIRKASLAPSNTVTFPLGTSTPSAIRMAAAYSVFANHGQQNDPFSVKRLQKNGADLPKFDRKVANTRVLDPDVADSITDVLQNVAAHGTGTKTNALGFPVAGKTGTTDSGTSAWWVGYTNSLTTSVGMWREEPGKPGLLSLKGTAGQTTIHGGDFPTAIFTAYMKTVGPGSPRAFTKPSDDPGVQVDSSGAPSTASPSPSASPSDSTSAAPTTTAAPTTGAPTDSPSPTGKPSRSCFLFCPSPTGDASPTGGGTSTKTPGGGGGGGGGGGAATGG
jgi:membrane peptidoglycan carboxypeptidase